MMNSITGDLSGIECDAKSIRIIESPSEFYSELIVSELKSSIDAKRDLNVTVLLDCLRGTRGAGQEKSSTSLLKDIAEKSKVYLYHTPELSGRLKKLLPEKTNEIIGLQHTKLYIFDDSILISGANLSDAYFTNRQDRYILFENCKPLADFFNEIVQTIGSCSFVLNPDGSLKLNESCNVHPFQGSYKAFQKMMKDRLEEVINNFRKNNQKPAEGSTIIYPLIQVGNLGINQEYNLLKKMFAFKDPDTKITMASGYFNCIDEYERIIFSEGEYSLSVVTASPKANGFYGANGLLKYVPSMYSNIATKFLEQRKRSGRTNVNIYEYARDQWTFHAKGIWMEHDRMLATLVGSSNYGYRSVHRDVEAQVLLVTHDETLRQALLDEKNKLFDFSTLLDSTALGRADHNVPVLIRAISRVIRNFF